MGRTPCCDREAVKRGPWSPEEDAALRDYIQRHGTGGNWISLPAKAASNWSADTGVVVGGGGAGLFPDFCMSSDLTAGAATAEDDHFLGGYYYPLDPSLSLVE
uniref:Uncharacterized protein n=1 Tax=Oryza brachyantha TaxID=4533 RepID=J3KX77_ORYBR